ncbi:DNA-directed DNA polymerase [Elysia marginata]|uniref:DNA-directed DNA polymerase n=1 Tax=Elysia marginata TaxID=1093978 RepID=A0AAV4FNS0_9GAST|nr:DNA-directed DNA polymerase [Elysia marginata]
MFLIFDTETTGLPARYDAPLTNFDNWPRIVQIAWQVHDEKGQMVSHNDFLIKPSGFTIPFDSEKIHGISTALAENEGEDFQTVISEFQKDLEKTRYIAGQNINFDMNILGCEFLRLGIENPLPNYVVLDTCSQISANLCKIQKGKWGKYKYPTLTELHRFLFGESFDEVHNAVSDVEATARCFFELLRIGKGIDLSKIDTKDFLMDFCKANPKTIKPVGLKSTNLKKASEKYAKENTKKTPKKIDFNLSDYPFVHLHNHTEYTVLLSTTKIEKLVAKANEEQMPAVSITDLGNLMGAMHFLKAIKSQNKNISDKSKKLKPIIGCVLYVCENHMDKTKKDNGYQMVFLAKTKKGYQNLCKMSSIGYVEGFYYVPRISHSIVETYKEDLIVLTGNLNGEISSKILSVGDAQAEKALLWWKAQFNEDLYIELTRNGGKAETHVNKKLLEFSQKHSVKIVATNNTYYVEQSDAKAHDILLCVKEGEKQSTPIGEGRGHRFGFENQEYYFKSEEEMKTLFEDLPEAIINISEIIKKIDVYDLEREVLIPKFDIPKSFKNNSSLSDENAYLKYLAYEGAKNRYTDLEDIKERLDFELKVIEKTGYPGYFLIVQDLIENARKMDVSVGPGRGSVAGSVVAYCLGITNINPIKYNLLFERFLNPDRISMPDIDIDFEDEGRGKVRDYVINKYGSKRVAQIITYGTMAAKSSVRDTARVLDLPLMDADRLAGLIPWNTSLNNILETDRKTLKKDMKQKDWEKCLTLKEISENSNDKSATVINQAKILEGSLRSLGTHACGVIITPQDITDLVPIATAKDSELYVTQFDNSVVEDVGLLKMDFLGLKTLSLIKEAVRVIEKRHGIAIDIDGIPLDDKKTYDLFQRGDTVGIFQYESDGMKKYMKDLKPTVFEDLIAMNALYRPGPMEYIPSFIKRKHGMEEITYDLDVCEVFLKETYGITVYQEQVMLLSQEISGFTKGEADLLRKAMGKKIHSLLKTLKPKFISGGENNGHDKTTLEKIWKDWDAFASYAFNKSHSTCYAWLGYQTAYLKANYTGEFMAAVLSHNMNNIEQVSFFLEECKRLNINFLGPNINESDYFFTVDKDNAILFGMGAIKGVGRVAVDTILEHRKERHYTSLFDMVKRIDLKSANKKTLESLAYAGAFDIFEGVHRAQYFQNVSENNSFLESVIRYGTKFQNNQNSLQMNLFDEITELEIEEPTPPDCEPWGNLEMLGKEAEVLGVFISGHPLDNYKKEIQNFCNTDLTVFYDLKPYLNKELRFAGIIIKSENRVSRNGNEWCIFTLEDYKTSYEFRIFGKEYLKFKHYLHPNTFLYIRAFIKPGWKDERDRFIHFSTMELLDSVLKNYAKQLNLRLDLEDVNPQKVERIINVIDKHKGSKPIQFLVCYEKEAIRLNFNVANYKVNISQELLQDLTNEGLECHI